MLGDRKYGLSSSPFMGDLLDIVLKSWAAVFDYQEETQLVLLDIPKAFDRGWHEGLLSKLSSSRFHPVRKMWISRFLSKCIISVKVDSVLSQPLSVKIDTSWHPFFLFTNDRTSTSNPIIVLAMILISIASIINLPMVNSLPSLIMIMLFSVHHLLPI